MNEPQTTRYGARRHDAAAGAQRRAVPVASPSRVSQPRCFLLPVLLSAPFLAQADATIVNVATPSIHAGLGASDAGLELVVGGYLIAFAVLLITGARLGQTHGYKRMFLLGIGVFAGASLLGGLAVDPAMLIAARVVQGAGAALMFPQALTGIQLNFDGPARARAIGRYAVALSVGAITGQIAGGLLVSADVAGTGWRPVLLVNVPIAAAVNLAGRRYLPDDPPHDRRGVAGVDLAGIGTLSVAVLLMVLPLIMGRGLGWPAWTWLCLAAVGPACVIFLRIERRVAQRGGTPLVNLRALARPPVVWGLLALAITTGTYYGLLFVLAQYLQDGLHRSALTSGLILVPWVAAFGVAGQIVRRLRDRRVRLAPAIGCLLLAAAYLAIGVAVWSGHHDGAVLAVLLAVGGLGLGINFSALISHLTSVVPARFAPDISGTSTTTLQIGAAVGIAALGTLYLALDSAPGAGHAAHALGGTSPAVHAAHALAGTSLAMAGATVAAALGAYRSTRALS